MAVRVGFAFSVHCNCSKVLRPHPVTANRECPRTRGKSGSLVSGHADHALLEGNHQWIRRRVIGKAYATIPLQFTVPFLDLKSCSASLSVRKKFEQQLSLNYSSKQREYAWYCKFAVHDGALLLN